MVAWLWVQVAMWVVEREASDRESDLREELAAVRRRLRAYQRTLVLAGPTLPYAVEGAGSVEMPTPETLTGILDRLARAERRA